MRESAEFKALKEQATLATQIDDLHFPPAVAGIGDAMPEFDKARQRARSSVDRTRQRSSPTLPRRATKILEANAKKYGG